MERLTRTTNGVCTYVGPGSKYETGELPAEMETQSIRNALHRLAAYEDTGLQPEEIHAVKGALMGREIARIVEFNDIPIERLIELAKAEKDNGTLTMEELQAMTGEPVWLVSLGEDFDDGWYIIVAIDTQRIHCLQLYSMLFFEHYGDTWLAYRRKPDEKLQSGGDDTP